MNLGLEYLIRSGLIKDFLQVPCSLFLEKKQIKKVSVILQKFHKNIIQHWDVSQCRPEQALPSMCEYEVDDFFNNPYVIPAGYSPLPYAASSIPTYANNRSHPMEQEYYESFFNDIMNSWHHRLAKVDWLWTAFLNVYHINAERDDWTYQYHKLESIMEEQFAVKEKYPKKWRYWQLWSNSLLKQMDSTPAELIFTSGPSFSSS